MVQQQSPEAGAGEGAEQNEAGNQIGPQPNVPHLFLLPGQVLVLVGSYWVLLQQPVILAVLVPVVADGGGLQFQQNAANGFGQVQRGAG